MNASSIRLAMFASGQCYHATRWASALAARGVPVRFLSVHPFERPLHAGVERVELPGRGRLAYVTGALPARADLRAWRPNLVHAHYATGYGLMSRLANLAPGVPRLVSLYGTDVFDFPRRSILHRLALGATTGGAATVLSTSRTMAAEYVSLFPSRPWPQVTPFGVDTSLFRPADATRVQSGLHVGVVKKLEVRYGVDLLLEAVRVLRDGGMGGLRVSIAGDGSQRGALEARSRSLGIDGQVTFLGAVENAQVPELLQALDLFVMPSRSESFGVAAVEAQACGIPVVAADVGGLPEVIAHEETGLLVPREDPDALAGALARLAANPALRRSMGAAGRARVLAHYDWTRNVDLMMDIYRRCHMSAYI